ncbi:MAG: amidophosphoribosyltransferase [Synergistaceae bacterium]|jgi:amidophosphoribosyltransferase|nr:amidophosphoribosyltransferase [Synergistaceae bacterium]
MTCDNKEFLTLRGGRTPRWREECGVFGVWSESRPVVDVCYLGLFALQHRGQESAGIAVSDGMHIDLEKGMGLMTEAFKTRAPSLKGYCAIGHVRYSTFGGASFANIQPIFASFASSSGGGFVCLAHNGSLVNAKKLRARLEAGGCVFQSTSDSESMLNLIALNSAPTIEGKILSSLETVEGAYSLTLMAGARGSADSTHEARLIGVRDPHGFRPLCLGRLGEREYVLASESCALDAAGAEFVRDVQPGEMVVIGRKGVRSFFLQKKERLASCVFEYIYFARPDSTIDGLNVWQARYRMGRQLAKEFQEGYPGVVPDAVVPVPDTGITAAIGFSAESGVPYAEGLIKNRYVGRTFILPEQNARKSTVGMKLNPLRENLKGRKVVLIDDSIVRGTTSARLIDLLRGAGAAEIHMCVSSPPITHPCYYGIDTSIRKELIAAVSTVEEIRKTLGTDSLHYLTLRGLLESVNDAGGGKMCTSCFHGDYPTDVTEVAL